MNNPADLAAKRLAWEMESWSTIEMKSHEDMVNNMAAKDHTQWAKAHFEHHYIASATGQRMFEVRITPVGAKVYRQANYFDGARAADVLVSDADGWEHQYVTIKREFGMEGRAGWVECPDPLRQFYVGLVPLPKMLAKAVPLGDARLLNRDCDAFLFPQLQFNDRRMDVVAVLDRETAVPLKFSVYPDATARAEGRPETDWIAESLDEVEGHHMPLKSTVIHYVAPGGKESLRVKVVVDEVHYDREFPKSTFWPVFGPDAVIMDQITGKMTAPTSAEMKAKMVALAKNSTAAPVRAVPPGSWVPSASTAVMGLGLAALLVGLGLWWRRR